MTRMILALALAVSAGTIYRAVWPDPERQDYARIVEVTP